MSNPFESSGAAIQTIAEQVFSGGTELLRSDLRECARDSRRWDLSFESARTNEIRVDKLGIHFHPQERLRKEVVVGE